MAGFVVCTVIALFLGGVAVGVIAVVAVAVRREDRRYTLCGVAPGRLASSARWLNGVAFRDLDAESLRPVRDLARSR
jgi:hypothetical protein